MSLSDKRKELLNNISIKNDVGLKILIKGIFEAIEKQDREAVKELKSQVKKYIVGTGTCCKMIAQINEIFGDALTGDGK